MQGTRKKQSRRRRGGRLNAFLVDERRHEGDNYVCYRATMNPSTTSRNTSSYCPDQSTPQQEARQDEASLVVDLTFEETNQDVPTSNEASRNVLSSIPAQSIPRDEASQDVASGISNHTTHSKNTEAFRTGHNMSSMDQTLTDPVEQQDLLRKKLDDILLGPNPLADVILDIGVEGKRIYTSRWLLADASDMLKEMFKEINDDENGQVVKISDVSLQSLLEFMYWVMPSARLPVTADTVELLLPLAEKLSVTKLQAECETMLIGKFQSLKNDVDRMKYLLLAQSYTLPSLYDVCVNQLGHVPLGKLKKWRGFQEVSLTTMSDLMACRLQLMELCATEEEDANSDEVTLLVENKPLPVCRYQLIGASPVFKAMLHSKFKEGRSREVVLPGKKYDVVKFVVDYVTSGFLTPIPDDLLEPVVALADEYLIGRIKRDCEEFMLGHVESASKEEALLYLYLAQTHDIPNLKKKTETLLAKVSHQELSQCSGYSRADLGKILHCRVEELEKQLADFGNQAKAQWTQFLDGHKREMKATCGYGQNNAGGYCPCNNILCSSNRLAKIYKFVSDAKGTTEQVAPFLKEFLDKLP